MAERYLETIDQISTRFPGYDDLPFFVGDIIEYLTDNGDDERIDPMIIDFGNGRSMFINTDMLKAIQDELVSLRNN
jgi:hypothetical protein